jgi:TolB-like protein/Flp pilus assembly protein TadD
VREVRTIAIIPLRNVGGKVDEDYIGQGLSEVLITKLSNIKTIVVRPTSAVMKYAQALPDASPDVRQIGRDLDVEAVLIGRVQKVDENIRVTVQLVRVSDGATLWAETFDDKFTNMFALQDSISEQVATSLAVTLTTGERQQLAKRFTTDSEALQLYLQGRYFWNKRTTEGLQKAIDYFNQAIGKDRNFARAYSGLADSYMLLGINQYLGMNQRETIAKAKEAANKAIALDDSLAEAHTSLGFMSYNFDFDWPAAEQHFRHAIELNPNYVTAHHWYSQFLNVVRRFDESEVELKKALQLDPSSLIINADYGGMFYYSRRYDQAVAQYKKTLDLEPRFAVAHSELGRVYAEQKRYDEAIAEQNQAIEISGRRPGLLALLSYAYGKSGRKIEAERILRELEELNKQNAVLPHSFVRVYIGINEKKTAMDWMEESFKQHQAGLIVLGIEPSYDFLRDEPRFQKMLAELKLTDGSERR